MAKLNEKTTAKLESFLTDLRAAGKKLTVHEIADLNGTVGSNKIQDEVRATIYIESIHCKDLDRDWDGLIPTETFIKALKENLAAA